jgi:hypothetical protein
LILVVVILLMMPITGSLSAKTKASKCITLYAVTFPLKKECVMLKHHSGKALQKVNQQNMEFYKGVDTGRAMSLAFNSTQDLKCPSGKTKEFCSGWKTTAR